MNEIPTNQIKHIYCTETCRGGGRERRKSDLPEIKKNMSESIIKSYGV